MNEVQNFHYFPPAGFMCGECKHSHDTLQKSISVRLDALLAERKSMAKVFSSAARMVGAAAVHLLRR